MVDFINKIEDKFDKLNASQKEVCRVVLPEFKKVDGKLFGKQSELKIRDEYLEFAVIHATESDTNFVIILFSTYVELSCAGFCFQFKYSDKEVIAAYILALLKGEYIILRTSISKAIIQEQLIWDSEKLEPKISKSFLFYFKFLFRQDKIVYTKFKPLSFI